MCSAKQPKIVQLAKLNSSTAVAAAGCVRVFPNIFELGLEWLEARESEYTYLIHIKTDK